MNPLRLPERPTSEKSLVFMAWGSDSNNESLRLLLTASSSAWHLLYRLKLAGSRDCDLLRVRRMPVAMA